MNATASSSALPAAAGPSRLPSSTRGGTETAEQEWPPSTSSLLLFLDPHSTSRDRRKILQLIPKEFITTSLTSSPTHILLDPSLDFNVSVSKHHRAEGRTVVTFAWALDSWDQLSSQPEELYLLEEGGGDEELVFPNEEEEARYNAVEDAVGGGARVEDGPGGLEVKEEPVAEGDDSGNENVRDVPLAPSQEPPGLFAQTFDKGKGRAKRELSIDVEEEIKPVHRVAKKPRPYLSSCPSVNSSFSPPPRPRRNRSCSSALSSSEPKEAGLAKEGALEDGLGGDEPLGDDRVWKNGGLAEALALPLDDGVFDVRGAPLFNLVEPNSSSSRWSKREVRLLIRLHRQKGDRSKELVWHGVHVAFRRRTMGAIDIKWRALGGNTPDGYLCRAAARDRELQPNVPDLVDTFSTLPWSTREQSLVDALLGRGDQRVATEPVVQAAVWALNHTRSYETTWSFVRRRYEARDRLTADANVGKLSPFAQRASLLPSALPSHRAANPSLKSVLRTKRTNERGYI